MKNRFHFRDNGVNGKLLDHSDRLEVTAEKCDEELYVRFKLTGGSSFSEEENDSGEALQFVRDLLDSFERSTP